MGEGGGQILRPGCIVVRLLASYRLLKYEISTYNKKFEVITRNFHLKYEISTYNTKFEVITRNFDLQHEISSYNTKFPLKIRNFDL